MVKPVFTYVAELRGGRPAAPAMRGGNDAVKGPHAAASPRALLAPLDTGRWTRPTSASGYAGKIKGGWAVLPTRRL